MSHYEKIAAAITYIHSRIDQQPSLEEIAAHVNLSPYHFQRTFSQWAGVTPKRLLQVLTLEKAKQLLDSSGDSVFDVSDQLGLSSASRLYDHFVSLEAVTPSEYREQGVGMTIQYGYYQSPFGPILMALTPRGICKLAFIDPDNPGEELRTLKAEWTQARFEEDRNAIENIAKPLFTTEPDATAPISIHVRGTNFQVSVWRALLDLQQGQLSSYNRIANAIGKPKASRAVGTAIGANPVALIIPCHRVIRQNGELGGYRWGLVRKQAILTKETATYMDAAV